MEAKCVWKADAILGEGPLWVPSQEALYWVDVKKPAVHRIIPANGALETWPMPEQIGCIVLRRKGGFVAGFESGLSFLDLDLGRIESFANPEPDRPENRFNDGKCDARGRFWAGTMDDSETAATGCLYRVDPDLSWHRMDTGYVVSNGPAFSPDGKTIYHTNSLDRTIYAFDLSHDGSIGRKREFLRFGQGDGYPDGMTTDAGGFLWVAHWGGWRVTRFTPDGAVDRIVELPVAQVTCCTFGGPDLQTLYITSASIGLSPKEKRNQPLAGGLFKADVGITGLPACEFAG